MVRSTENPLDELLLPDQIIIDPHHHVLEDYGFDYGPDRIAADLASGHRVSATIAVECGTRYRPELGQSRAPQGEIEYIVASRERLAGASNACAGIVAHADLQLGGILPDILRAYDEASGATLRGIRHSAVYHDDPAVHPDGLNRDPHLLDSASFRQGAKQLAKLGLTFDTWIFYHQLPDLARFCDAAPELTVVLDHIGSPIAIDAGEHADAVFAEWRKSLIELARRENAYIKLGGLGMAISGFTWQNLGEQVGTACFQEAVSRWYLTAIDIFGPSRCMFISNAPADLFSVSYFDLWNTYKRLTSSFTQDERDLLFHKTCSRVYDLDLSGVAQS